MATQLAFDVAFLELVFASPLEPAVAFVVEQPRQPSLALEL